MTYKNTIKPLKLFVEKLNNVTFLQITIQRDNTRKINLII